MRFVGLLVLMFATLSSFAQGNSPKKPEAPATILDPRMRSEYAKADPFIRAIVDQHEATFPGAMSHPNFFFYAQLNRISYIQQGLVMELMATPGFQEAFRSREPMTDLAVTVTKASEVEAQKFNDKEWKEFLEDDVLDEIKSAEEKIKEPRKRTVAAVLEILRKNLIKGWNESFYPESSWFVSSRLKPYVVLATLARQAPDASLSDLKAQIPKLDVGALDYFQDAASWKPLFDDVAKLVKKKEDFPTELAEAIANVYEDVNEDLYDQGPNVVLNLGDSITIREVHPNFAIFRGYVGNDCSTCFSPGFVLNPFDRYYYAFDSDGKRLGYVGLSIVKIRGKKALLIHTIQGPDFSEKQTQLVMRAFKKAAPTFGAKRVVLSSDSNIDHNVNFSPIRRTMMAAVEGQKELPLTWADMKYREIIAKWDSQMTYDDPKANPLGRELPFDDEEVEVSVTQTPFDFTLTASTPEMIEAAKKDCTLRLSGGGGGYGGWSPGDGDGWAW